MSTSTPDGSDPKVHRHRESLLRLLRKLRLSPLSFGIATGTFVLLVVGVIWF